jgi:membrane-associated phospholipid phosphatase
LGLAALGVRPGGRFAAVLLPSASAGCRGRLCRRGDGRAGDRTERAGRGRLVKRSSTAFGRRLVEWTIVATPIFALSMSSVLDHRLAYDNHGIFYRPYQLDFEHGVMAAEGLGALWFGVRSRLGRTFWQAIDASLFTAATTTAMKYAFSRARPYQSSDPHDFFQGNCCQSFPSGEVAYQASVVTPFIAEYRKRDPWIWGLEIFPLYDAVARMKTWGHWQTDVISGFAIGTAWGIFAHEERVPFTVSVLPGGVTVGFDRRF